MAERIGSADDPVVPQAVVVRVECYAGYRGEQEPRRFSCRGSTVEVIEVVDRRQEPQHRTFTVRGSDGCLYRLRHDELRDRWQKVALPS